MAPPSTISDKVDLAIRQLMDGGMTGGARIYRQLEKLQLIDLEHSQPSPKAVQRRVAALRPTIDPQPWSLLDADPDEVRLVAPVLRYVVSESQGRLWLSRDLARWVEKVRAADHSLPAKWAWIFALAYQGAKLRDEDDARCLDLALMSHAWAHPTALQPVVYWPELEEHPALRDICQRMGRSRQLIDLVFGQQMWVEAITEESFDLPPWADDEPPAPDNEQV